MHRQPLLKLLAQYRTRYREESACVDRFIQFVEGQSDCFERSLAMGHVTGSAWVVNHTGDKVLLTHHRKLNKWLQFGGHADGHADILAVALRETQEESGLKRVLPLFDDVFDVDIHEIPARKNEPVHDHYDIRFALRNVGSNDYIVSDESHDLAWIEIEHLGLFTTEPSMLRMAGKWVAYAERQVT